MSKKNIKNNIIPKDVDLKSLLKEKKNELKKFDMDYRPISYWGLNALTIHLLSSIKSKNKRDSIKDFINKYGENKLINEKFTKNKLHETERETIKKFKKHYYSDEFIPKKNNKLKVEIARLTMKSTLGDYISFVAQQNKENITYTIVDEYESNFHHTIKSSQRPLTFREIIKLIDESTSDAYMDYNNVYGGARQSNYDDNDYDPEEFWDFEIIDSTHYNRLYDWYILQNYIWLIERKIENLEN